MRSKESRRQFIRSAGIIAGTTIFSGSASGIKDYSENRVEQASQYGQDSEAPEIIDIHLHTHFPRHPGVNRGGSYHFPSPDVIIKMMDENGVAKAVVLPVVSPECMYSLVTPEEVLAICEQHPGRFIPFCNVDPRFMTNSPKADFMSLFRAYKELGCKGIGEYFPNIPLDDPLNLNVFRQAEEIGFPVTFHLAAEIGGYYGCYDEPGLPRLEKVLKQFPKLVFLGHSQVFWAEMGPLRDPEERKGYPKGPVVKEGRVVELMRKYPNLHGDLSAGSGYNAIARDPEFGYRFLEEFQDRLYWGTDIDVVPINLPIVPYFRKLKKEKLISETAYEKITWKNATKLLGI
jgi:predicted TIM-barrel fold metal-dependent hydrolase